LTDVAQMPCQELVELLTAYLDGTLEVADRERLEAHLKLCDPCVVYIEQFRETIAASGHLHARDLAPETQAELLKLFNDWRTA
jgi:anti-sigma factor RsiW